MQTAKLFNNGCSQAVRLPKEFRFSGDDVYIKKYQGIVMLLPKESLLDLARGRPRSLLQRFYERKKPAQSAGKSISVIDFLLDTDTCIYLIKTPLAFTLLSMLAKVDPLRPPTRVSGQTSESVGA